MSIWFIGPEKSINSWRSVWPAMALRKLGHDAHAVCIDGEQEADLRPGDTVVVHHGNNGGAMPQGFQLAAPFLAAIRAEARPRRLVVQWDDSFVDLPDIQDIERGHLDTLLRDQREACEIADAVVVTTPYLAERIGWPAEVVPNWIASWVTELNLPLTLGTKAVWLGTLGGLPRGEERGSAHLHDWLWAMRTDPPAGFPLHVVGIREYREHRWFAERFPAYTYRRHTTDLDRLYREVAAEACVGLAPVDPALGFNRAKSWIKPLEYAALGIPQVMSRTDEYLRVRLDPTAPTPDAFWFQAGVSLDLANNLRMEDYRSAVRAEYSIEANVGDWEKVLDL